MAPGGPFRPAQTTAEQAIAPLVDQITWLPQWVIEGAIAVIIVFIGWYIAKAVVRLAGRPVARRFERPSVARTVLQGIRILIITGAVAVGAQVLGFRLNELLLSVTVFSAVLAVVLAPIVGSFISGLFVLADQPFEIGDMIQLVDEDIQGYVDDITLRYTKLFTLDNTFIVVPNSTIRDRDILNYSAEDERIRRDIDIVITYESDLDKAQNVIERAAREVDAVVDGGPDIRISRVRYPARPTCYIVAFGDHGIQLRLRYWVERPYRLLQVESDVQKQIWEALADTDIEFAYPHSQLVFDETTGEVPVALRHRTDESQTQNQRMSASDPDQ